MTGRQASFLRVRSLLLLLLFGQLASNTHWLMSFKGTLITKYVFLYIFVSISMFFIVIVVVIDNAQMSSSFIWPKLIDKHKNSNYLWSTDSYCIAMTTLRCPSINVPLWTLVLSFLFLQSYLCPGGIYHGGCDCLSIVNLTCASRPDLLDQLPDNSNVIWFAKGSSYVRNGKR